MRQLFSLADEIRASQAFEKIADGSNGDVKTDGDVYVHQINAQKVICKNLMEYNRISAGSIACDGDISCNQIDAI